MQAQPRDLRSMSRRGLRRSLVGLLTLALLAAVPSVSATAASAPQSTTTSADPTVGPLFPTGLAGNHDCTASVLSAARDLLLTAAHCVSGTEAGVQFVPGYDGTAVDPTPYGVWTVDRVWVSPAWRKDQDPQYDYAILRVADRVIGGKQTSVETMTGGNSLGIDPATGTPVTVPAYPAGRGDAPIDCHTTTFLQQGFPGFTCSGYIGGTSGAPWLAATGNPAVKVVVGVVGGLHEGGCRDVMSYSALFLPDIFVLVIRALFGFSGDDVRPAAGDGC